MTRKDYLLISASLRKCFEKPELLKHSVDIIEIFSVMLKKDNPRFDPVKFRYEIFKDGSGNNLPGYSKGRWGNRNM